MNGRRVAKSSECAQTVVVCCEELLTPVDGWVQVADGHGCVVGCEYGLRLPWAAGDGCGSEDGLEDNWGEDSLGGRVGEQARMLLMGTTDGRG